jgi:hypothetical protein
MFIFVIVHMWLWGALAFYMIDEKIRPGSARWWRNLLWPVLIPCAFLYGVTLGVVEYYQTGG